MLVIIMPLALNIKGPVRLLALLAGMGPWNPLDTRPARKVFKIW